MNKAEKQGKTAMIYFYAEHCPAYRMFEKYVFANETVIKKSREFSGLGGIRTLDLSVKSRLLYLAELQALII